MTFSFGLPCEWHRRWAEYPNCPACLNTGVNPLPWLAKAAINVLVSCSREGSPAVVAIWSLGMQGGGVVALWSLGMQGGGQQQEKPCFPTYEPAIL